MNPLHLISAIILSVGALQSLICGGLILKNKGVNASANRLLAGILFFLAYRLGLELLQIINFGNFKSIYPYIPQFNWGYGVLVYWFTKAYLNPKYRFNLKTEAKHLIPVGIELLWTYLNHLKNVLIEQGYLGASWLGYESIEIWSNNPTQLLVAMLLIFYYSHKSIRLIELKTANDIGLIKDRVHWLDWILTRLKYYALICFIIVLLDLLFLDYEYTSIYRYPIFIMAIAITYWIGMMGYSKKDNTIYEQQMESTVPLD